MKEKLIKLLDVKSVVTLTMTVVFAVLSLRGKITSEQFLTVFTVVISFYFGTQYRKNSERSDN
ncbi:MAG: hypothetical protein MR022_05610 [Ruminococcus sp.]|nr:hypothetical protein [Ruminococcus sp.]